MQCSNARTEPRPSRLVASLAAIMSFLRGLPLFVTRRPRTPLRAFCVMAFDTVYVLRNARRLPAHTLQTLASLLDFGACLNDFFDGNDFSRQEYRTTRRLIERGKTGPEIKDYVNRLRNLENRRPPPGGDIRRHRMTQSYRESVVRLSLAMIAATTLNDLTIEDGIRATYRDEDLETLYRIVMLCQIIDDVLDFTRDADDGLPSFLTAHASPHQALTLTAEAAARYADWSGLPASPPVFPFRVALSVVSMFAKMAIGFGRRRLKWLALRNRLALAANRHASADTHS